MSENPEYATEFYIPLIHPFTSSLLDYLPNGTPVLVDDWSLLESTVSEIEEQAVKLRAESIAEGTLADSFPIPYITWSELSDTLSGRPSLELGYSTAEDAAGDQPISTGSMPSEENLATQFGKIERFGGRLKPFTEYLARIVYEGNSVVIVSRQASRLEELWMEHNLPATKPSGDIVEKPQFVEFSLSEGWSLGRAYLITDSEILVGNALNRASARDPVQKPPNLPTQTCGQAIGSSTWTMVSAGTLDWSSVRSKAWSGSSCASSIRTATRFTSPFTRPTG